MAVKNNITRVDFQNKRVRHFKDEPTVKRTEVEDAITALNIFMNEDFFKKVGDYNDIEQVVLHEIEDAEDELLMEHAEEILLNLKDVRNVRREAKECLELQKKIANSGIKKGMTKHTHNAVEQHMGRKPGSSEVYYENKMKRTKADADIMSKAMLKNMLGLNKKGIQEDEEESK